MVAVVNDSVGSTKLGPFQERFPERLVNVGIAEQDMVGVGAGLANGGKVPFVSAAACFLTGPRAGADQGRRGLLPAPHGARRAEPRHGLRRAGPDAPLDRGPRLDADHPRADGRRPCDPTETAQALRWAAAHDGPVYVRIARMGVPGHRPRGLPVRARARPSRCATGTDVTLVGDRHGGLACTGGRRSCWRPRASTPGCCRCRPSSRSTRTRSSPPHARRPASSRSRRR